MLLDNLFQAYSSTLIAYGQVRNEGGIFYGIPMRHCLIIAADWVRENL